MTGIIKHTRVKPSFDIATLSKCPRCQVQVEEIKRYSSIKKMVLLPQTLDELYLHFGRELCRLMWRIYMAKIDFKNTRQEFRDQLGPGPLAGKANEVLVTARLSAILGIQVDIAKFRGKKCIRLQGVCNVGMIELIFHR